MGGGTRFGEHPLPGAELVAPDLDSCELNGPAADAPQIALYLGELRSIFAGRRAGAAEALGRIRAREAVAPLCEALQDRDPQVRIAAVEALDEIDDPGCIAALANQVEGKSCSRFRWPPAHRMLLPAVAAAAVAGKLIWMDDLPYLRLFMEALPAVSFIAFGIPVIELALANLRPRAGERKARKRAAELLARLRAEYPGSEDRPVPLASIEPPPQEVPRSVPCFGPVPPLEEKEGGAGWRPLDVESQVAQHGSAATPLLIELMRHGTPHEKIAALDGLALHGDRRAIAPLRRQIERNRLLSRPIEYAIWGAPVLLILALAMMDLPSGIAFHPATFASWLMLTQVAQAIAQTHADERNAMQQTLEKVIRRAGEIPDAETRRTLQDAAIDLSGRTPAERRRTRELLEEIEERLRPPGASLPRATAAVDGSSLPRPTSGSGAPQTLGGGTG